MEASVWTWSVMITWAFSFHCTTSDDNCTDHFTPNQVARMHCYLDLVYQKWLMDRQPSPIPLAPIVTDQSPDSVSIYWLPPVRGPLYERYGCMGSYSQLFICMMTTWTQTLCKDFVVTSYFLTFWVDKDYLNNKQLTDLVVSQTFGKRRLHFLAWSEAFEMI